MSMSDKEFAKFISGTKAPEDTVTVYKVDRRPQIKKAEADLAKAVRESRYARDEELEVANAKTTELVTIVADLHKEMEDSAVEVLIRSMTTSEYKEWYVDDDKEWQEFLAVVAVKPSLTVEQWGKFGDAIGGAQTMTLFGEAKTLTEQTVVVPDLSRHASAILAGTGSDKT